MMPWRCKSGDLGGGRHRNPGADRSLTRAVRGDRIASVVNGGETMSAGRIFVASLALACCVSSLRAAAPWMPEYKLSDKRPDFHIGKSAIMPNFHVGKSAIMPDLEEYELSARLPDPKDRYSATRPMPTDWRKGTRVNPYEGRKILMPDTEDEPRVGWRPPVTDERSGRRVPDTERGGAQFPTPGEER